MKFIRKVSMLLMIFSLVLVLTACGGEKSESSSKSTTDSNRNSENSINKFEKYKSEELGIEFDYDSNFNTVKDLSEVELFKNEDGTSYKTEGIEKVLSNGNKEIFIISSEDSQGSTIEELKSKIDQVKLLFESIPNENNVGYIINSNEIIEINGSKVLKTEMVINNIKTNMISIIKNNKIISIQYISESDNYNEQNVKTILESLKF